jgi:hopanoid-associated phosphorylase
VGHVTLLVATGLRREARLMAGRGIVVIAGGGDSERLERELEVLAGSASAILSSGLAGALAPDLRPGDVVIGTASASLDANGLDDSSAAFGRELGRHVPNARTGLVWASDRPVADAAEKKAIHGATGALAVDMESHIAARVAARHRLPFAALRVISDAADVNLPHAALAGMRPDGGIALGAILSSLAQNPAQLPALIRVGRDAARAFRVLGGLHDMLRGRGIGSLDPRQLTLDMA